MSEFRIVSLCPSTTYTLHDLGLGDSIVGRTGFCIHPKEVKSIKKVGGTKNPNFDKINELNPTHIMFNNEENDINHIDTLSNIASLVERTPIEFDEVLESIDHYGLVFNVKLRSTELVTELKNEIERIKAMPFQKFSYIYVIWRDPIMAVGRNTFIESTLSLFGGENSLASISEDRYPQSREIRFVRSIRMYCSYHQNPFHFQKSISTSFQLSMIISISSMEKPFLGMERS